MVSTKAPTESALPLGHGFSVAAYSNPGGVESLDYFQLKKYTVTDISGNLTPVDGLDMRVAEGPYMFYGFSPSLDFKSGSNKTISITAGTDFKVASMAKTINFGLQTLQFPALSRKCAYAQFAVQCVPGDYVKTLAIGPGGFTLSQITHSPVDYTLGQQNIDLTGVSQDGSLTIAKESFLGVEGDPNRFLGGTVVLPKTNTPFTISFDAILNGVAKTMTANVPEMAFTPGYRYLFSLVVCDPGIALTLQVVPWVETPEDNDLGVMGGHITIAEWNEILNPVGLGQPQGAKFIVADWTEIVNALLHQGVNNSAITVANWVDVLQSLVHGVDTTPYGTLVIGAWTNVNWNHTQGVDTNPYGTIGVNDWAANTDWSNNQGIPNTSISISDWTVNPDWSATTGVPNTGIGVGAWTDNSQTNTMGE
jgi:hypothetical protein